jgi:hypothetical protein
MTRYDLERSYKHKMHHHAIFNMADGSTVEGNMQPWDDEYVYLTLNEGASGGKVKIADIKRIEFPDE